MPSYQSWGKYPAADHAAYQLHWRTEELPETDSLLPHGSGRSYGDVNTNDGGAIVSTERLDHFISFDEKTGLLTCEAGVTIADILKFAVPRGWFVPVSPGTKFVSIGGAIANDVHGKNHHRAGTLGRHVPRFEILCSDNRRFVCSSSHHAELYRSTIGGIGLTGLITWAKIQLKPIQSAYLDTETIHMDDIDDFVALSEESDKTHEYTVAWVDTTASGARAGRGLFMRGNHAPGPQESLYRDSYRPPKIDVPRTMPRGFINMPLIKAFNWLYRHKQLRARTSQRQHYDPFFYPLDAIVHWNRLYGPRGFQSFQCVVPHSGGKEVIRTILEEVRRAGLASPLTVLKMFGDIESPGVLSFPRPGFNLLLDFPNIGTPLNELLVRLDRIVMQAGGRVNPAKDAHLSAETFQAMYPNWREFAEHIDPAFSSGFWRRVTNRIDENTARLARKGV